MAVAAFTLHPAVILLSLFSDVLMFEPPPPWTSVPAALSFSGYALLRMFFTYSGPDLRKMLILLNISVQCIHFLT